MSQAPSTSPGAVAILDQLENFILKHLITSIMQPTVDLAKQRPVEAQDRFETEYSAVARRIVDDARRETTESLLLKYYVDKHEDALTRSIDDINLSDIIRRVAETPAVEAGGSGAALSMISGVGGEASKAADSSAAP